MYAKIYNLHSKFSTSSCSFSISLLNWVSRQSAAFHPAPVTPSDLTASLCDALITHRKVSFTDFASISPLLKLEKRHADMTQQAAGNLIGGQN